MDWNKNNKAAEDKDSIRNKDEIKTDIRELLKNGGVDYTQEINRMLIQGIDGNMESLANPLQ